MAYSVEVFSALQQFIEKSQSQMLRKMKHKQKIAEKHVEGLLKELEVEIAKLNARNSELEKISCSEDHLYIIQVTLLCIFSARSYLFLLISNNNNIIFIFQHQARCSVFLVKYIKTLKVVRMLTLIEVLVF